MNCLQSKKQKTGNNSEELEEQQPTQNYRQTNGHNGHSSLMTNGHHNGLTNGHSNGYTLMQTIKIKIAVPDMCIFCFDVLHNQLHNAGEPRRPSFTNQS